MTLPAFSIARPIARGIAHPIAAHEGVGVNPPYPAPSGYVWDFVLDYDGTVFTDYDNEPYIDLFKVN